jgi:hypothetical protein
MKTLYLLALLAVCGVILMSCSGSKKLGAKESSVQEASTKKLFIRGFVMFPDSSRVAGAAVRTEPPSEFVTTATDGSFSISEGLNPALYDFIAEYQGEQGKTTAPVQFTSAEKAGYILIFIGKEPIKMEPLQPGRDLRLPSLLGRVRTGN